MDRELLSNYFITYSDVIARNLCGAFNFRSSYEKFHSSSTNVYKEVSLSSTSEAICTHIHIDVYLQLSSVAAEQLFTT